MRLSKKEPTANFDDDDIPVAEFNFGPKLSEPRTSEVTRIPRQPRASIGSKITMKGELSGEEDLLIEGTVEGSINLGDCLVAVGSKGQIKADIKARAVNIEGQVDGDVHAKELVTVKVGSKMNGNLKAERVHLEDGAKFRGGIEMTGDN